MKRWCWTGPGAAAPRRAADAGARPRADPGEGQGLRSLPICTWSTASCPGRSCRSCRATRSSASGGHRPRRRLVPRGRARRHPLARLPAPGAVIAPRARRTCAIGAVHRLSDRWRLRRIRRGGCPLLLSDPGRTRRPRGGAVAVRGLIGCSLAAHGRRGRAARDLRLRRRRSHRRSGRTTPGPAGVRLHAGGRPYGAGVRASWERRGPAARRSSRPKSWTPRSSSPRWAR